MLVRIGQIAFLAIVAAALCAVLWGAMGWTYAPLEPAAMASLQRWQEECLEDVRGKLAPNQVLIVTSGRDDLSHPPNSISHQIFAVESWLISVCCL